MDATDTLRSLLALHDRLATGRLSVKEQDQTVDLYLLDGNLIASQASDDAWRLVDELVGAGHLPEARAEHFRNLTPEALAVLRKVGSDPVVSLVAKSVPEEILDRALEYRLEDNVSRFIRCPLTPTFQPGALPWVDNIQIGLPTFDRIVRVSGMSPPQLHGLLPQDDMKDEEVFDSGIFDLTDLRESLGLAPQDDDIEEIDDLEEMVSEEVVATPASPSDEAPPTQDLSTNGVEEAFSVDPDTETTEVDHDSSMFANPFTDQAPPPSSDHASPEQEDTETEPLSPSATWTEPATDPWGDAFEDEPRTDEVAREGSTHPSVPPQPQGAAPPAPRIEAASPDTAAPAPIPAEPTVPVYAPRRSSRGTSDDLEAFAGEGDDGRGGGADGVFVSESEHLDTVDLEAAQRAHRLTPTLGAPTLGDEEAEHKILVTNEVLGLIASCFEQERRGQGAAIVQILVDGRPREYGPLLHDIAVRRNGTLPPQPLIANLRARPEAEQRRLIHDGLLDLLDRALDRAAEELEEEQFDHVLEESAGYRQRFGL